jgi:rubrerythrin
MTSREYEISIVAGLAGDVISTIRRCRDLTEEMPLLDTDEVRRAAGDLVPALRAIEATFLDALRKHPEIHAVYLAEQEQWPSSPRHPRGCEAGGGATTAMNAFDWLPARTWTCPRCAAELETREPDPRCPLCGAREDE